MEFPSIDQSRNIEKSFDRATRIDLARLRLLIRLAPTWLAGVDDADRCRVFLAVMDEMGSTCIQKVFCEMRVLYAHGSRFHEVFGFCIFDDAGKIFIGPRAERDPVAAATTSAARSFPRTTSQRISTWMRAPQSPGLAHTLDPRNSETGRTLVAHGVALLQAHELTRKAKLAPAPIRSFRL